MILNFEYTANLGRGKKPQVVHMMDNSMQIIYINEDKTVGGLSTSPPLGVYDNLSWQSLRQMSPDENVSCPSLKKVAHFGAYGFWSANNVTNDGIDHKFVMYMLPTDISETLVNGNISYSKDSAVSSASFNFINVDGSLLRRYRSLVAPNARLDIQISVGTSKPIDIGKWYIDRVSLSEPGGGISVSARNAIGKLLKEQSFDENTKFEKLRLVDNLRDILQLSGAERYWVAEINKLWKLAFQPEDNYLQALEDIIKLLPSWKIDETADGTIGIGPISDYRFEQPSTYAFVRDSNCWSYNTEYSDEETYSRLCVKRKEPAKTIFIDLPPHKLWQLPLHRTLYIDVPDGSSDAEMQSYAANLSTLISRAGRVENFTGRFTPQMIVGDEIKMTAESETKIIGVVTTVKHSFGQSGYYTEFTVDSGGRKGRLMLKDYMAKIGEKKEVKSIITENKEGT